MNTAINKNLKNVTAIYKNSWGIQKSALFSVDLDTDIDLENVIWNKINLREFGRSTGFEIVEIKFMG